MEPTVKNSEDILVTVIKHREKLQLSGIFTWKFNLKDKSIIKNTFSVNWLIN